MHELRRGRRRSFYRKVGKRALDFVVASLLLVVMAVPLVVAAFAVRMRMGSPVLFRQTRIGRHGRPFEILKLRTMTDDRDANGNLRSNDERLTPLGRLLRRTSLDELPQLWNVLRGEMSLVGPRPLPAYYLPHYTTQERRRHEVRPGITGLAQVRGRKLLDWDSRLALDLEYVEALSFGLDARVMAETANALLRGGRGDADPPSPHPTLAEHRGKGAAAEEDSDDSDPPTLH